MRVIEKCRKEYFDYLSMFACLAVLFMHHNGLAHHFEYSVKWFVSLAIEVFCYWAVPCFFMMSGAKLMKYRQRQSTKEFLKKRFFKVVIPWIAWSLIFLLLRIVKGSVLLAEVNARSVVSWVLNADIIEVYWFFPAVIAGYLCIPVLSFIAEQKNGGRILTYMAVMSFVFVNTLPYLSKYIGIDYNNDFLFPIGGGYVLYVILGYLCDITEFSRTQRITIYVLAIMSAFFRYLITAVLSTLHHTLYDELFEYNQYHAVLLSMGVFVFFKYVKWPSSDGKIYSIVKYLAGCSYGVYLLHIVVEYQIVERCGLFKGYIWMLIAPFVTGCLCVALIGVIKKIPLLKQLIP